MRTLAWPAMGESGAFFAPMRGFTAASSCISPSIRMPCSRKKGMISSAKVIKSSRPPLPRVEKERRAIRGSSARRDFAV